MHSARQAVAQAQQGKDCTAFYAGDFFEISGMQLRMLAADIAAEQTACIFLRAGMLRIFACQGCGLVQRRKKWSIADSKQVFPGTLVNKGGYAFMRTPA